MSGDCDEIQDDGVQVKTEGGNNGNKVCSVCGDLALGFNFNALTCESCKAFFRRNALKAKEFKCPFTESCVMTAITRRFCQRCRLQKCFSVGMRKEYIMSEEERLNKRHKIEQNRARKRAAASTDDVPTSNAPKQGRLSHKRSLSNAELSAPGLEWSSGPPDDSQNSPGTTQSQDGSPHQVSDSLSERLMEPFPSPTTASSAGSVPSPNSPPDSASATVAASQNTEMIAMRDIAGAHKQSMISLITYPHHTSQGSESQSNQIQNDHFAPNSKVLSVSSSTQTSPDLLHSRIKILKTTATQTNEQPSFQRQPTPLLSSLISNQRSDEAVSTHQETSTPAQHDPLLAAEGTGGWKGVDGVNGRTIPWDSCAPSFGGTESNVDEDILRDVFRIPVVPNSIESILSEAIKLEFSTYTPSSIPAPGLHPEGLPHSRELNDAERAKLNELIVANKALLVPLETSADPRLLDIINLTAVAIRRLVKMAKKINAFKNMCQEDQVALLKGACMEMLILHSATTYNPVKDSWAIPHSTSIKVDVLKECRGNLYQEHRRFQRSFDPRWRTDENIMLILSAIALFTPDRPNIVHQDVIKLEQNSYYYLLRRYLECTLPGCEARSTFLKLIQKISELRRLNEEHVRAYLDVDPSEVEPLLIEIFDLKPPNLV